MKMTSVRHYSLYSLYSLEFAGIAESQMVLAGDLAVFKFDAWAFRGESEQKYRKRRYL